MAQKPNRGNFTRLQSRIWKTVEDTLTCPILQVYSESLILIEDRLNYLMCRLMLRNASLDAGLLPKWSTIVWLSMPGRSMDSLYCYFDLSGLVCTIWRKSSHSRSPAIRLFTTDSRLVSEFHKRD